jgi:diguanylate cyclase (GGDEF)-like protein
VKYTGRIVITAIIIVLLLAARLIGYIYYDVPVFVIPYFGAIPVLICWWLGIQYDKVKFYSEKDILTSIHNRRYVLQLFPKLLVRMDNRNEKLVLYLIDVDDFKKINDTYGHEMGDKVLQSISNILLSNTTNKDIVARWAGDEFLIISPSSGEESKDIIIQQINLAMKKLSEEINNAVSVSIGASVYPDDARTLDALLHISDSRMYRMKYEKDAAI